MLKQIGLWFQKNPETIPLGIGLLCLLLAVALLVRSVRLVVYGVSAEGVVTDLVERRVNDADNKTRVESTATIRFKAGNRDMAIQRSWDRDPYSHSFCFAGCYAKGERLKIRYLAENPETASIDSFFGFYGGPLILGIIGAMGLFIWKLWRNADAAGASPE